MMSLKKRSSAIRIDRILASTCGRRLIRRVLSVDEATKIYGI
jgi:hypothetical protein